jgi:hypothetical protein
MFFYLGVTFRVCLDEISMAQVVTNTLTKGCPFLPLGRQCHRLHFQELRTKGWHFVCNNSLGLQGLERKHSRFPKRGYLGRAFEAPRPRAPCAVSPIDVSVLTLVLSKAKHALSTQMLLLWLPKAKQNALTKPYTTSWH